MRLAILQSNPTIGAISKNLLWIEEKMRSLQSEVDLVITPEQASEAFICCCFLTTEVENLPASLLRPLLNILWLMADCFLVTIDVGVLPPIEDLPSTIKKNKLLAKLYPMLRSNRGICDISLADAARLVEILKPVSTVIALQMFRFECFYVSRGLIFALNLVEEAIP